MNKENLSEALNMGCKNIAVIRTITESVCITKTVTKFRERIGELIEDENSN